MMNRRHTVYTGIAFLLLFACIFGAGCISSLSPLPSEVMVRENIIAVDTESVPASLILTLLTDPNSYETGLFDTLSVYLPKDNPVIEVGAGIGAVSAYVNDRLLVHTDHIAVEPNPYYTPLLKETKEKNKLGTRFVEGAISYEKTFVPYVVTRHVVDETLARAYDEETVDVLALTISQIIRESGFTNTKNITLIVDAEGIAAEILENEPGISESVKTIIATVNSAAEQEVLLRKAVTAGYVLVNEPKADGAGLITLVFERG